MLKGGVAAKALQNRPTQEQSAFDSFKSLCAAHGLLKRPAGLCEGDVVDGINDDATLLRFFHARQCDVSGALKQFKEAWHTRDINQIFDVYEEMDVHAFEETRMLTMSAYHKSSSAMKIARSDLKIPGVVSTEMLRAFCVYENLTRFILPLCTAVPERSDPDILATKMTIIVDISSIGVRQICGLRRYVPDLSKIFAIDYPEVHDKVLLIGALSFPTIWGWLKKWVDPNTVNKLRILSSSEVLSTIQQHVDIENIPTQFGGHFDYQHGMKPSLDHAIADILTWMPPNASLPMGLMEWVEDGKGGRAAVTAGNSEGRGRGEKVAGLKVVSERGSVKSRSSSSMKW